MAELFSLYGEVGVETANLERALQKVEDRLKETGRGMDSAGKRSDAATRQMVADIRRAGAERLKHEKDLTRQIAAEERARATAAINEARRANQAAIREIKERQRAMSGGGGHGGGHSMMMGQTPGDAFLGGLTGGFLGAGTAGLIGATTASFVSGGRAVLDYSSRLEQARIGFETMGGSAAGAERHLKDLEAFARTTPFAFDELVDASRKMQGVGISAERVIPILTDVGNSLSAAGRISELPFAIKALGDIQAKGKLAGQEIIQLANAGIPIRDVLAKSLGVSTAKVIEMGEAGEISAKMVFDALHEMSSTRFGDAMAKQSRTFAGAMSNITDALYQTSARAFEPLYKQISVVADELAQQVGREDQSLGDVGALMARSVAKGFASVLVAELQMEVRDIADGKTSVFAPFNATVGAGAAAGKAALGGSNSSLPGAFWRQFGKPKSEKTVADLEDLRALNFLGGWTEEIRRLEALKKAADDAFLATAKLKQVAGSPVGGLVQGILDGIGAGAGDDAKRRTDAIEKSADGYAKTQSALIERERELTRARLESASVSNRLGAQSERLAEIARVELAAMQKQYDLTVKMNTERYLAAAQAGTLTTPETMAQRRGDAENLIEQQSKMEVARLAFQRQIDDARRAESLRRRALENEIVSVQAQAISAVTGNPVARMFDEAQDAVEGVRDRFRELDPVLLKNAVNAAKLVEQFKLFKAAADAGMSALKYRQMARDEGLRRADEMNGFSRRMGGLDSALGAAGAAGNYRFQAERDRFYSRLGDTRGADADYLRRLDARAAEENYDRQAARYNKLAGNFGDLGAPGTAALAKAKLDLLPSAAEMIEMLASNDARTRASGQTGLQIRSELEEKMARGAEYELEKILAKNAQIEKHLIPDAMAQLRELQSSGLPTREKMAQFLQITGELGDEITPELSRMRQQVAEQSAKDDGAIKEALLSLARYIAPNGGGVPVNLNGQGVAHVTVQDSRNFSAQVTARPNSNNTRSGR